MASTPAATPAFSDGSADMAAADMATAAVPSSPRATSSDVTVTSTDPADVEDAEGEPNEESVNVKPVDTVSAIDLVMGGEEDGDEGSPPAPQPPQD